jgi:hypothetical protein
MLFSAIGTNVNADQIQDGKCNPPPKPQCDYGKEYSEKDKKCCDYGLDKVRCDIPQDLTRNTNQK